MALTKISGSILKDPLNLGEVSIGGTLTYQDVTNVDSVGIITARSTIDAQGDVSIADKIIHTGDTNTAIRFPAADTIQFETSGHDRIYIKSDGFIGIGTDAPLNHLHLNSNGNNGVSFRMENYEGYSSFHNDGGALHIDAGFHIFRNQAGSTEFLRINSSGKATFTTPGGDDALLIKGDNYTSVRVQSARNSASDHAMFQMLGSRGTNASPTIVQSGDTLGTLSARGYDGNSYAPSSNINFGVDGTPGDGDMPGRITFSTAADGSESPTERLRITSEGKIGIGDDDPDYMLQLKGTIPALSLIHI